MENTKENQKDEQKTNNSASSEIPQEIQNFRKICSARCTICSSGILKELHEAYANKMQLKDMVILAQGLGVQLSTPSLSRHFKSYRAFKADMAAQIIKNDVLTEVTSQAVHLKKTVELLDLCYTKILVKFKANTYNVDIGDLEKLAKIRYQILNGENLDESNLAAIFQKATDKYGVSLQQGMVFKQAPEQVSE